MLNFFFKDIFFRNYAFLVSEAKYKVKYENGLKILSHKQMFQRLPISLAQGKAGNTSKNLLNKIHLIIYCIY